MLSIDARSLVVRRIKQEGKELLGPKYQTWFFRILSLFFSHPSIHHIRIYNFKAPACRDWEVFLGQDSRIIKHTAFFQLAKYHDHL